MGRFIAKRLLYALPVLLIISFISYFLMYLSPGDPAEIYLSKSGDAPSAEALRQLHEELGLDDPFLVRYLRWGKGVLKGDLGNSIYTGRPVAYEIAKAFPNTLKLTFLSIFFTLALSIPLGIASALNENRVWDNIIRFVCFFLGSLPGFFVSLMLMLILGVKLRLLPTISANSPKGIWIPTLTLVLTMCPSYIRQVRAAVLKELEEDYIRLLRGRGIRERTILLRDVLKSVLPSILTIAGVNTGRLMGGTAIIESICSYQGLGELAVNSITHRDYPLMQGFVLMMALIYSLVNLTVDILNAFTDPRVKNEILNLNGERDHAAQ